MHDLLDQKLRISDKTTSSTVGDEAVLLHLEQGTYYALDEVGALIWQKLKEGLVPREIPDQIVNSYEIDQETAEADVRAFLQELKRRQLILCDEA